MFKKAFLLLLLVLLVAAVVYRDLLAYGLAQARGQFGILYEARPLAEVLENPTLPDSVKARIRLIGEIKQFAIDSLGLDPSDSYTTYYDQHNKPILWVITAAQKYKMVAKEWSFPIIGAFAYKGFFDSTKAVTAQQELDHEGFDTNMGEVSAWSTLGFFSDPILSSMLRRSEGSLANLIIHEMTHGTLFIKDNLEYNENLASFVGDYGAIRFLKHRFGINSPQLERYQYNKKYGDAYANHVLRGAKQLDSLYLIFEKQKIAQLKKNALKIAVIQRIMNTADTLLGGKLSAKVRRWDKREMPNNAFFIGYLTYRSQQNEFQQEFEGRFKGNFPQYLAFLKAKYPSL